MSKHTPGPWKKINYIEPWADKDSPYSIASFDDWVITNVNKYRPEFEANARLIAAAPEMLEALIETHKSVCMECCDCSEFEHVRCNLICATLLSTKNIIEKATGRNIAEVLNERD